ncbi:MAG: hypothetical protein U9N44_01590 [Chloroflexota bacterium]|nr:hypothetical protein [Chloroflexota bacterium]
MKTKKLCVMVLLGILLVSCAGCGSGITKPQVSYVPADWALVAETEDDGVGVLMYMDSEDFDTIAIAYGEISGLFEGAEPEDMEMLTEISAMLIFEADETGTMTIDNLTAGYAKAYDSDSDTYDLLIAFTYENTLVEIIAIYDAPVANEVEVMSLIESIYMR